MISKLDELERGDVVKVGMSTCGLAAGAEDVFSTFIEEAAKRGIDVKVKRTGCLGLCYGEPMVEVKTEGLPTVIYGKVTRELVIRILEDHILEKRLLHDHIYRLRADNVVEEPSGGVSRRIILVRDTSFEEDKTRYFYTLFLKELRERDLIPEVQVVRVADMGIYDKGVVVEIFPQGVIYANLKEDDVRDIVVATVIRGEIIDKLLFDLPVKQMRIATRNCGIIDPTSIDEYIARGGYSALERAVKELGPEGVIEEIKRSGLRGRGGAGFPTWLKWYNTRKQPGEVKYVICNGDEGDPGAYMDRSILEGDPHSVLEGLIIAGYAVGAKKGFFYIRAEYPLAVERVEKAIEEAYKRGFLGENILGSGFSFDVEVRLGAGAFVCGEETALIASIEGKRGTPRPRPPYPSESGLWEKPTAINNVETLANVPPIIVKGGEWYAAIGTERSKGTKVFALTGKIRNSGLIEVPMGVTLRDIIFEIGGGLATNNAFKAVQTGGPSGGVIPEEHLDTPVTYEDLAELGSIMGSGGMIVMDESDCMVDVAKFYLGFCVDESCGKCAPCRIGGVQMLRILERITEGKGEMEDIDKLEQISFAMKRASLCGLGQTAPNPVLSTLKYFRDEYIEHIRDKRCRAHTCRALLRYVILDELCRRCGLCARVCPVDAIKGDREHGYQIDPEVCIKCGNCMQACKFGAIVLQ